jgi:hypothetical protein
MFDIFISYAFKDMEKALAIKDFLESKDLNVWWDEELIDDEIEFRKSIYEIENDVRCMVVIWSQHSIDNDLVISDAREALTKKNLVAVMIDEIVIPLLFDDIKIIEMIDWQHDVWHETFNHLLNEINIILEKSDHLIDPPDQLKNGDTQKQITGKKETSKRLVKKKTVEIADNINAAEFELVYRYYFLSYDLRLKIAQNLNLVDNDTICSMIFASNSNASKKGYDDLFIYILKEAKKQNVQDKLWDEISKCLFNKNNYFTQDLPEYLLMLSEGLNPFSISSN